MIDHMPNSSIGTALPCVPATVVPHAVAHANLPETRAGLGTFRARGRSAGVEVRHGGEVSRPAGGAATLRKADGPITGADKYTCASVPGRRGGT